MSTPACGEFLAHAYLHSKCRNCQQEASAHSEEAIQAGLHHAHARHSSQDGSFNFAALPAPTPSQLDVLKPQRECETYLPHTWIQDRCRDCGGSESAHKNSASFVPASQAGMTPEEAARHRMQVREPAQLDEAAEAAAARKAVMRAGSTSSLQKMEPIQEGAGAGAGAGAESSSSSAPPAGLAALSLSNNSYALPSGALSPGQMKTMKADDNLKTLVATMNYYESERSKIAEADAERLAKNQISQEQYDQQAAALQAAFDKKEAEIRLAAEEARTQLEEANVLRMREVEELKRQVEEAQQAAASYKLEAEAARAAALAEAQAQSKLVADATTSRDSADRKREEVEAQLKVAQREVIMAHESHLHAQRRELEQDDREEQPASPNHHSQGSVSNNNNENSTIVAKDGEVQLNDVLNNVAKLFQLGRNCVRFTGNKPATFSAVFIRELAIDQSAAASTAASAAAASAASSSSASASPSSSSSAAAAKTPVVRRSLYSLCWCKADERVVDPSRSLDFSELSAVVLGKQATVLKTKATHAADNCCVSFIAGPKCNKKSLHLQFGNQRDAETWAYGIASLMKEFGVKPAVFEAGQYFEQASENAKDYDLNVGGSVAAEVDDGSHVADQADIDSIATTKQPTRYQIELSCKCANLPSVHKNTIVCLVDRNERTNKLEYLNQSERISGTDGPIFKKRFPLHYTDSAAKTLRFNVYDIPNGSKNIEDEFRMGSAIVGIKSLVDKAGAEFVFSLSHKAPKRQAALEAAMSTLTVTCATRRVLSSPESEEAKQAKAILKATEKELAQGDVFTNYVEEIGAQNITMFYTPGLPPASAAAMAAHGLPEDADRFDCGSLNWASVGAKPQSVPLRTIVDVFVGKKHKVFPAEVSDEHAFSLVSKLGVRLDLEAKSKAQRNQWVEAIVSFLKAAAIQQGKDKAARAAAGLATAPVTPASSAPASRAHTPPLPQ